MSTSIIDRDRIQVIRGDQGPTHAVVPWDLWTEIEAALAASRTEAEVSDEELFDTADTSGEAFPMEVVEQLVAGTHPVKVYRKYRGLTQADLARAIGSTAPYISQIENGRPCGRSTLLLLANALGVEVGDLIARRDAPPPEDYLISFPEDRDTRKWDASRQTLTFYGVYCDPGTARDVRVWFRVPGSLLARLEGVAGPLSQSQANWILNRHPDPIARACGVALAERRPPVDGAIPIDLADLP